MCCRRWLGGGEGCAAVDGWQPLHLELATKTCARLAHSLIARRRRKFLRAFLGARKVLLQRYFARRSATGPRGVVAFDGVGVHSLPVARRYASQFA